MKYMAQVKKELGTGSPLALSVLELLDEEPMHPYEMATRMRVRHHDEFIRLNFGTLYHTVEMLERHGWIEPVEREKEGRRPERTIYRLTDAGRDVLTRTISDLLKRPQKEYPQFAAGLMFMHHLRAADAAAHLKERAEAIDAVIAKFETVLNDLLREGVTRLALIEVEHKIAMLDAERRWVRAVQEEIASGRLEWRAGMGAGHEALRRRHGSSAN
jgi:DNA-binding PadR family transcriptional regulator